MCVLGLWDQWHRNQGEYWYWIDICMIRLILLLQVSLALYYFTTIIIIIILLLLHS